MESPHRGSGVASTLEDSVGKALSQSRGTALDYIQLGRTGTTVSRIVLGTMNFGDRTSEDDAFAIMDRALELGVNFFDTANGYGGSGGRGATEEIIGRWFAARPGVRDDIVLATKVHSPMVDPTADGDVVNARGASAWQVRREAIGSLRRLQTDRIDLYQFHHIDRHISWPELWQSMETLVARGEVHLHRQLELRGVEHRAGQRDREAAQLPRPGQRAVPLQPGSALDRARSHPGREGVRPRHPSLVSPRRRPAQRRVRERSLLVGGSARPAR